MSIKPPRPASIDPRVAEALGALAPSQRATLRSPDDPRVNPPRFAPPRAAPLASGGEGGASLRARAEAAEAHQRSRDVEAARRAPDPGHVLAKLPRSDGTELRVSLHRYEGRPFVRVAPWSRGAAGEAWPVKGKGATLKTRELAAVARALLDALDASNDAAPDVDHALSHGQGTSRRT